MPNATLGSPYPLRAQAADANTGLFPRAVVRDSANNVVTTVDLTHIAAGLYGGTYTFTITDYYSIVYVMYSDAGHTTVADYDHVVESVQASVALEASVWDALIDNHLGANSMGEALAIVRGLLQCNYVLDNTVYNSKGLLTSGRIRVFKNKADTDAGVSPIVTLTIGGSAESPPNDMLGAVLKVTRDP